ncbi:MAG: membrane-binding protein, partial [Fulvivirga sp.]
KSGHWGLFYEDGLSKGEVVFNEGTGEYKEYYKNGNIRLIGTIVNDKHEGVWKYYYEGGELEGECDFTNGRGEYYGYYPDGTLQTKGTIEENSKKVGRWELYKNDGTLSGYYKPIYDQPIENQQVIETKVKRNKQYGVGAYKYKGKRKFNYFDAKGNEFQGLIMSFNPFATFIGRIPFGMEFYMQERLGHEFEFEGIRDPFFTEDFDVPLGEVFTRGYSVSIRQKFYNKTSRNYALWYFGHELRFSNESHFVNTQNILFPDNVVRASASEQRVEYMLLLGYRLIQNTRDKGFTIDLFVGAGSGYRNFENDPNFSEAFDSLEKGKITFAYTFGVNFGYNFSFAGSR